MFTCQELSNLLFSTSVKNVLIYWEEAPVLCNPHWRNGGTFPSPATPVFHSFVWGLYLFLPHLIPFRPVWKLKVPCVISLQPLYPFSEWLPQAWERHHSTACRKVDSSLAFSELPTSNTCPFMNRQQVNRPYSLQQPWCLDRVTFIAALPMPGHAGISLA